MKIIRHEARLSTVIVIVCALTSTSVAHAQPTTDLRWSSNGPIDGMYCTQVHETADPHTWLDNYLCANRELGLRWSSAGAIAGMRCTMIHESREPAAHTWNDNYLCLPSSSELYLRWSSAGPIDGLGCVQVHETADPHTWLDNYLCYSTSEADLVASGWCYELRWTDRRIVFYPLLHNPSSTAFRSVRPGSYRMAVTIGTTIVSGPVSGAPIPPGFEIPPKGVRPLLPGHDVELVMPPTRYSRVFSWGFSHPDDPNKTNNDYVGRETYTADDFRSDRSASGRVCEL